ncbi:MAG: FliG C-terminal domain-containing protein [Planctomycetota bacterium]|jgi:flagellar motor switch protein FliG
MKSPTNGIRKAAIVVASLSRSAADRLLGQMDPEQERQVRRAVVDLGPVDPDERERVLSEFFRVRPMVPEKESPGIELDGRLARTLSFTVEGSPDDPAGDAIFGGPPFGFLREAEGEKLADLLTSERPQTIALVLAHLPAEQAGKVLARLAPALQVEVVHRLVDLEETEPEILQEVEQALQARFSELVLMQRRRVAGMTAVSGILDAADGPVGAAIFRNLAALDRPLADRLSPRQAAFDDLLELDDASLVVLLEAAGPQLALLALVGAPPAMVERMCRVLGDSQAEVVRQKLDNLGPTRLSDVEEARRRITDVAQQLALEGKIVLPSEEPSRRPVQVA